MKVRYFLAISFLLVHCNSEERIPDESIAKKYCGSCHLFPHPDLLDKNTWDKNVLPKMSSKLGIASYNGQYVAAISNPDTTKKADTSHFFGDWSKIVQYYTSQAPLQLLAQKRLPINTYTNLFSVKEAIIRESISSTSFLRMDTVNQLVYMGNLYDSSLVIFDKDLKMLHKQKLHNIPVHMEFADTLAQGILQVF